MGVHLILIAVTATALRMTPLVAVLAAERVKLISDAVDDAFNRFFGFGTRNGNDGNVGFVLDFAVCE